MNWTVLSWVIFAAALAWPVWFALRRWMRRRRRRRRCEACGYDLRGRVSDRCPECGLDVTRPLRLIRWRSVLLHSVILMALLTASHLVNRIEAIQKRGWIAAVPTTVLIPYVLNCHQPWRFSDSAAAKELVNCRATTPKWNQRRTPFGRDYDGPEIDMARWQWRWLIQRCLDTELNMLWEDTVASSAAWWILETALRTETATPAQRDRILHKCTVWIESRQQWPVGSEMRFRFGVQSVGDGVTCTVRPIDDDQGYATYVVNSPGFGSYRTQSDFTDLIGIAARPGPVRYEVVVTRRSRASVTPVEMLREIRTVTIIASVQSPMLQAMTVDPKIVDRWPVRLVIRRNEQHLKGLCSVQLAVSDHRALLEALGDATFGALMRLKWAGEVVGVREVWNSRRAIEAASWSQWGWPDAPTYAGFWIDGNLIDRAGQAGDSEWSVEIEGDPNVALRDFESTSYWAGTHEFRNIPVERVEK